MEFSLSPKEQAPQDIVVVGSSMYPRLDQAAVEAMSRARGATEECETARYMFTIEFKLGAVKVGPDGVIAAAAGPHSTR